MSRDPERHPGGGLLGPPDARDLLAGDVGVGAAGLAVGADAVRHLDPGVDPAGDRAAGAEVDVVGVRGDDQHALDLGVVEHSRPLSRRRRCVGRVKA